MESQGRSSEERYEEQLGEYDQRGGKGKHGEMGMGYKTAETAAG